MIACIYYLYIEGQYVSHDNLLHDQVDHPGRDGNIYQRAVIEWKTSPGKYHMCVSDIRST